MIMPVMFTAMMLFSPSGVVLYWFVSQVWAIGQQYFTNWMIGPTPGAGASAQPQVSRSKESRMSDALTTDIAGFVEAVVRAMGVTLTVSSHETDQGTEIRIEGEDGGILTRRGGEGPAGAAAPGRHHVQPPAGRRPSRGDRLQRLPPREGRRAAADGALHGREGARRRAAGDGPAQPYERRIVHLAIAEDPSVASESIGDAFMKTVIISRR